MLIPVSSTIYLIDVKAPAPAMSESANALLIVFALLNSDKISSTNSTGLSLYCNFVARSINEFLNSVYCFFAYCKDLTILISLSTSRAIARGATPACFKIRVPYSL